jgi:uncharacterized membrane protein
MEFVRFLHVLLGAIWMGGAMYGESMVAISAKGGRDVWARTHIRVQQTSSRIYPIVVPLTAITAVILIMGSDHLDWGDTWISAALALWLVGMIVGIAYFTRKEKDFVARLESDGVTDELVADLQKTSMVQRMDLLLLLALLVLMIFQPGS